MGDNSEAAPEGSRLRVTFEAFCATHERAWLGFARTQVGDEQDTAVVVEVMKGHLLRNWAIALRQEIPAAYAWRLLKEHLAAWLAAAGRPGPALVQTAAFDAAIRNLHAEARSALATPAGLAAPPGPPGPPARPDIAAPPGSPALPDLDRLPEQLGLFSAILELPERQHDVVVLKYCLELDDEKIAEYLGTQLPSLRSTLRHARRRLARSLGLPDLTEPQGER
ncbi:hypothetical protein GCM10009665_72220 [Kitasatospora nipponensis]|uniref:RNA polymerase sigma factor 70 region 4 type 2 domain-containing protein n=1 Tax=Kitasatospora nipponensis TaxID=258049 RepID=A0ABP4HPL8_9ACTN